MPGTDIRSLDKPSLEALERMDAVSAANDCVKPVGVENPTFVSQDEIPSNLPQILLPIHGLPSPLRFRGSLLRPLSFVLRRQKRRQEN
jgi:hypothetical protein